MSIFKRHAVRIIAPLLIAMVVAGCGSATIFGGQGSRQASSQADFITLKDTSPGQLDVRVMVSIGGYDTAARDTTTLDVGIAANGHGVKMVGDERVVCNSLPLKRYVGSFELSAATASLAGKPVICTYTSGSSSATITFTVPAAPVILSPQDGESVTRGSSTTVTYRTSAGMLPSVVATGAGGNKAIANQGATSSSQAMLDTSAFTAGSGQIALTQEPTTINGQNQGFKSLMVRVSAITMVTVTWA